ncbi:MAG: sulfite exporter TauE/SafE family protein, partial [Pseudomonadota bacterium]|nr:sulfite exporter TauE/SafE family protein [Pseudomonadota bacterium]
MISNVSLLAAFLVGLLGGVHCVGMCGGIVGALSLGLPERQRTGSARWLSLLAYNAGRVSSYTLAGALLGGIGWLAANWSGLHQLQQGLQLLAALFMVALGLYLGGWWQGLVRVEHVGGLVWNRLEPLGRRFLPVKTPVQAFFLGLIWGWLPCGLVYSVLVWSISTGDPLYGAALLFSFGLGTLPNLLLMGAAAAGLSARVR